MRERPPSVWRDPDFLRLVVAVVIGLVVCVGVPTWVQYRQDLAHARGVAAAYARGLAACREGHGALSTAR